MLLDSVPESTLLLYYTAQPSFAHPLVPDLSRKLDLSPSERCGCVLQDSVPESTLLVYHTAHLPQQVDKPNKWESDPYLYPHIAQMNAAGRHVAQSLHYHVLDTEAMALQLPKEAMMADITHPGAGFMMQVRPPPAGISFS